MATKNCAGVDRAESLPTARTPSSRRGSAVVPSKALLAAARASSIIRGEGRNLERGLSGTIAPKSPRRVLEEALRKPRRKWKESDGLLERKRSLLSPLSRLIPVQTRNQSTPPGRRMQPSSYRGSGEACLGKPPPSSPIEADCTNNTEGEDAGRPSVWLVS